LGMEIPPVARLAWAARYSVASVLTVEGDVAADFADFGIHDNFHIGGAAFGFEHGDDLGGGIVAEELAEDLFVVGNSVFLDQRDEIGRGVTGEGGLGEMRIFGEEVFRLGVKIREVAAAAAGDQDFLADFFGRARRARRGGRAFRLRWRTGDRRRRRRGRLRRSWTMNRSPFRRRNRRVDPDLEHARIPLIRSWRSQERIRLPAGSRRYPLAWPLESGRYGGTGPTQVGRGLCILSVREVYSRRVRRAPQGSNNVHRTNGRCPLRKPRRLRYPHFPRFPTKPFPAPVPAFWG